MKVKRYNHKDASVDILDGEIHGWNTWVEFQRKMLSKTRVISIADTTLKIEKYTDNINCGCYKRKWKRTSR